MNSIKNDKQQKIQSRVINLLAPIVLLSMFLLTRVPGLGQFVTADETLWLRYSANFYYSIRHGDWAGTFQSSHPGVTTMWAGAIGFHLVFPEYAEKGEAETSDYQLRHLLLRKGVNPLEVLAAGRAVSIFINALAFLILWPLSKKLIGKEAAFIGLSLFALDPFILGHQRLLHQDGTQSSFMLLSLLSYLMFRNTKKNPYLVISAFAGGIAALTKSPSWFIFPMLFFFQSWDWLTSSKNDRKSFISHIAPLGIWLALALVIMFILYPAMWNRFSTILTGIFQYALDSAGGIYSGPVFFWGRVFPYADLHSFSWIFYIVTGLWRSTPLSLLGIVLATYYLISMPRNNDQFSRKNLFAIIIFAIGFTMIMSLGTKKFDRYLLPSLGPLLLVAGWGLVRSYRAIRNKLNHKLLLAAFIFIVSLAFSAQIWGINLTRPYFINYVNPMLGGSVKAFESIQLGWGEGMEKAAHYLMQEPDIENKQVAAWYSTSFNLIFEYDAEHIAITPNLPQAHLDELLTKDYLVIYVHQHQRETPANLLSALEGMQPVFNLIIDGLSYVQIYQP